MKLIVSTFLVYKVKKCLLKSGKVIYRRELFRETTGTSKALHLTFVTTYGVAKNAQYGMIQSEITMDDLFKQ